MRAPAVLASIVAASVVLVPLRNSLAQVSDAERLYQAGLADRAAGKLDRAIVELEGATSAQDDHVGAHYALAWCYVQKGDLQAAKQQFQRVVELAPDTSEGRDAAAWLNGPAGREQGGGPGQTPAPAQPPTATGGTPPVTGPSSASSQPAAGTGMTPAGKPPTTATPATAGQPNPLPSWTWVTAIIILVVGGIIALAAGNDEVQRGAGCGCAISLALLFFYATAIFTIYGWSNGLIVWFVLGGLITLSSLLGLIPVLGNIGYWFLATRVIIPAFFSWYPAIPHTWLVDLCLWSGLTSSILMSLGVIGMAARNQ